MSDVYLVRKDELYHYGVKGMRWGHTKARISTGYNTAMGKIYDMNAKTYQKSNKTLSSMNKASATQSYKKAAEARAKADSLKKDINKAKAEKKEFKQDVKNTTKLARKNPYSTLYDQQTGMKIGVRNNMQTQAAALAAKRGQDYAERVFKKSRNQQYKRLVGSTAVATGAIIAAGYLGR